MHRTLWVTLGVATVLAGPVAIVLNHHIQSQDRPAAPVVVAEDHSQQLKLTQLEAELAALKMRSVSATGRDREDMEAKLNALRQEMSALGKTPTDATRSEPRNLAEAMAAEEEETRQLAQHFEATLASEAADPSWSAAAAQEISRTLSDGALEHTKVGEVRCGTNLCRIEASHDNVQAEQGFVLQLGQLESFRQSEGFGQRVERSDGSVATTLFVSRSGHRLPNPAASEGSQS
ncbi:MAG: hypothetical protein ABW034_16775 [Steroidobacteraceae bacterium]